MLIGAAFLHYADRQLPHVHFDSISDMHLTSLKKYGCSSLPSPSTTFLKACPWASSFGSGEMKNGVVLAIAIALQNIPEGLAVALPLVGLGYNKWKAVGIATLTGLVEPVGGLLGITMVTVFQPILAGRNGLCRGCDALCYQ